MSTTKRLSVKAEKPQDQTCASQAQALIDHILDEKTTELSKAIDDAVVDSLVYGSAVIKAEGQPVQYEYTPAMTLDSSGNLGIGTATRSPFVITNSNNINTATLHRTMPRYVETKRATLETHPVYELTVEQLRAAWMLTHGTRWVSLGDSEPDDYMDNVALRLKALGELEVHNVTDQYAPMARIKI